MNTSATGQLFGYSLQFPRALLQLLQGDVSAKVGIEICGDVAVFFPAGKIISEEDKSSLSENTLTDRSSNLWKTFYNWINAIIAGDLVAARDRFVLYTNHSVSNDTLVKLFAEVKDEETARNAVKKALECMAGLKKENEISKYINIVLKKQVAIFEQILVHFDLIANPKADDVYDEIRNEIAKKAFEEKDIEFLLDNLTGWTQKTIMERIASKTQAIISVQEIMSQIRILGRKIRQKELIDFALGKMPTKSALSAEREQKHTYIRQLEFIKISDDKILEAVSDYFRAHTNRQDWIEREIVDEKDMADFEGRLCSFHANSRDRIELMNSSDSEEKRGYLLLTDCQSRQETIASQTPPDRTIQGSYHVLADEERLGWHPQWKELIEIKKEDE